MLKAQCRLNNYQNKIVLVLGIRRKYLNVFPTKLIAGCYWTLTEPTVKI